MRNGLIASVLVVVLLSILPSSTEAESSPIVFSASGDYGTSAESWPVIGVHGGAFHLILGDSSYGSPQGWCGAFKAYFNDLVWVAGNHDSGDEGVYTSECPFPFGSVVGEYGIAYYFDYPTTSPLIRIILTTPDVNDQGFALTQNAIRSARTAGIPWVAVGMHKVCIEPTGDKSCEIGRNYFDMIVKEGADLILHAHAHTYSRSHQLICGNPSKFIRSCVVDSDGTFVKGAGTVVVIQGIGGQSIRTSRWRGQDSKYFATTKGGDGCSGNVPNCPSANFGMVQYTLDETSLTARAIFTSGEVFDPWSIGGNSLAVGSPSSSSAPTMNQGLTFAATALLGSVAATVFAVPWIVRRPQSR